MVAVDEAEVHVREVIGVWGDRSDQIKRDRKMRGERTRDRSPWRYDERWPVSLFLFQPFYHSTKHDTTIASKA